MTKETIKKIARYSTKQDGTPLMTKSGRPYTSVRIQLENPMYEDKFISGFESEATKSWKVGDEIEIDISQNGEYLNFSVPKKEDKIDDKLELILNKLTGLQIALNALLIQNKPRVDRMSPAFDPQLGEVPEAEVYNEHNEML